jgi:hypothetical protein
VKKAPIALLFALAALAIFSFPSTAGAITLTNHIVKPHGITEKADRHLVLVRTVAPADSDDDGCPDTKDSYNGPGCNKPAPEPVAAPVSESVAPAPEPATTSVPTASGGYSIPSYIVQCESGGSYTAQNPSGAYGAYQIMPSTASAYGCDLSTPAGQDSCAASIYADVGSSAWSCG